MAAAGPVLATVDTLGKSGCNSDACMVVLMWLL
jgi:hypothetical protein